MKYTTLLSGSAGNSVYIEGGRSKVLVDVGCSLKYLQKELAKISVTPGEIDAILLTHEHNDHISGAAALAKKYAIPIYASPLTWRALPFAALLPPLLQREFTYDLQIGDLTIDFFKTYHDAAQPVGMVVRHEKQSVGVMTDTGQVTDTMLAALEGVCGLVLEANHSLSLLSSGPYPPFLKRRIASQLGHLSNQQAADALSNIVGDQTQAVILAHLSRTNNSEQVMFAELNQELDRLRACIGCQMTVAGQEHSHPLIELR